MHHLLRAYNIKADKNTKKEILIEKLTTLLEGHTLHGMPRPDVFILPQMQNTSAVPIEVKKIVKKAHTVSAPVNFKNCIHDQIAAFCL